MSGITVTRQNDDLVAVKRADPIEPDRCRAEADVLRRIDHPGVVQLVAFIDGDTPELRTRYVGTDTWARSAPRAPTAVTKGLAAVAATIADLHDLGVNHGALTADHVVVGAKGQPILCGFARSRALDAAAELDDMVALAALISDLSDDLSGSPRAELDDIAGRAAAGAATPRQVAYELSALSSAPKEPGSASPRLPIVASAAVLLIGAAGAGLFFGAESEPPHSAVPVASPSTTQAPSTTTTTTTTAPRSPVPPSEAEPSIEFVHEGRRYGLGSPGDLAVVGDWDCDGVATPALLQTASGVVSIFDTWPEPRSGAAPSAMGITPGAVGLEAVEYDGCHRLRVLEPGGSHLFTPEA